MTPTPNPPSTGAPKTTLAGVLGFVAGLAGIFLQVWGAMHGQGLNTPIALVSLGLLAHGKGLIDAADK